VVIFDNTTGKLVKDSGKKVSDFGDVSGPGSSTNNRVASFDGLSGKLIKDSGVLVSELGDVNGPGSSVANRIATFSNLSGKLIKDSGVLVGDLVKGPATALNTNLAAFDGTTGKIIKDSGVPTNKIGIVAKMEEVTFTNTLVVTTTIPFDDTIPQKSEGTQIMNFSFTPLFSGSRLVIDVSVLATARGESQDLAGLIISLFDEDGSNDALNAAFLFTNVSTSGTTNALLIGAPTHLTHTFTTSSISALDFRVRMGLAIAGINATFNGQSGNGLLGTLPTSRIRITEFRP